MTVVRQPFSWALTRMSVGVPWWSLPRGCGGVGEAVVYAFVCAPTGVGVHQRLRVKQCFRFFFPSQRTVHACSANRHMRSIAEGGGAA